MLRDETAMLRGEMEDFVTRIIVLLISLFLSKLYFDIPLIIIPFPFSYRVLKRRDKNAVDITEN